MQDITTIEKIINTYGEKYIPQYIPIKYDELKANFEDPKVRAIVAEKDKQIVGTAIVMHGRRRIRLFRLSTIDAKNDEIISAILEKVEDAARELVDEFGPPEA